VPDAPDLARHIVDIAIILLCYVRPILDILHLQPLHGQHDG